MYSAVGQKIIRRKNHGASLTCDLRISRHFGLPPGQSPSHPISIFSAHHFSLRYSMDTAGGQLGFSSVTQYKQRRNLSASEQRSAHAIRLPVGQYRAASLFLSGSRKTAMPKHTRNHLAFTHFRKISGMGSGGHQPKMLIAWFLLMQLSFVLIYGLRQVCGRGKLKTEILDPALRYQDQV